MCTSYTPGCGTQILPVAQAQVCTTPPVLRTTCLATCSTLSFELLSTSTLKAHKQRWLNTRVVLRVDTTY